VDWKHDAANNAYMLAKGDFRCRVWRVLGAWQAIVSYRGEAITGYNFATAEGAVGWCEIQMAELKAQK